MNQLSADDFEKLFGIAAKTLPQECRELIAQHDFSYQKLTAEEADRIAREVDQRIANNHFTTTGSKERWEQGWSGNLEQFEKSNWDLEALVPKFIRPDQVLRIFREFVKPKDPQFEYHWYQVFRLWLFKTYLSQATAIYEFGCGSGFNLPVLAKLFPEKKIVGLDWIEASKNIVNEMGRVYHWNMAGRVFDFFSPDPSLVMEPGSVVLTIGALEQTGQNYEPFLQFVLNASPSLCVHVEPICEWYDPKNPLDSLAIKFHKKRRYWEGFPDRLRALEQKGQATVIKMQRSYFGSIYLDGYSYLIWKPTPR